MRLRISFRKRKDGTPDKIWPPHYFCHYDRYREETGIRKIISEKTVCTADSLFFLYRLRKPLNSPILLHKRTSFLFSHSKIKLRKRSFLIFMTIDTNNREFYLAVKNVNDTRCFFQDKFKKLTKETEDKERITFLFSDSFTSTKRYERFEKKLRKKILEYFTQFLPYCYDSADTAIADYILNITDFKGDFETIPFRHAIEESAEQRKELGSAVKEALGTDTDLDFENPERYTAFVAHIDNELRKVIKNSLVSKVIYNRTICESNYTLATEFSEEDMYFMLSSVIQNAMNYVIFNCGKELTPCCLDFNAMKVLKNAQIQFSADENSRLQAEIDSLNKRIQKVSVGMEKVVEKKILIDNPDLVKENRQLKEDTGRLKEMIKELEEVISLKKTAESDTSLAEITGKRILFVGGYSNEQQKLQYVFRNAGFLDKNSTDIQPDYLSGFDHVVFLTHHMSHSIYHKAKRLADISDVPYMHCTFNNIKLITEYIAKQMQKADFS